MAGKAIDGQRQHTDVDQRDGQAAKRFRDGPAAQTILGFRHQHDGQQIAEAAAKAEADGLFQRKALGALDQNGAQHAAVHGSDGQDADELAAAQALGQLQDHQLKQADHRDARKIYHRAKLGAVGQRGEEAARIKGQRSHQYLRDAEHQREPPAAGPLVADQLDKAGNAEAAGEDGILGKDGQHRVAEEHAHKMQHFAHSFSSFPLSWLWGCTAR